MRLWAYSLKIYTIFSEYNILKSLSLTLRLRKGYDITIYGLKNIYYCRKIKYKRKTCLDQGSS